MTDQAKFMSAVRAALGRSATQAPAEPPPFDDGVVRLARRGDKLVELFSRRAIEVGMHIVAVKQVYIVDRLAEHMRKQSVRTVVTSAGYENELTAQGFELVSWKDRSGFDRMFDVHAGITPVQAALAETGTLVCNSGAGFGRGLSLVPEVHYALVRASDILPDMVDYWSRFRGVIPSEVPSNMVFITGPSKTADIEGHLVQGVHGPRDVYIFLVEDA